MLKLVPVHSIKDLKVNDLVYLIELSDKRLCRVDDIQDRSISLKAAHGNLSNHAYPGKASENFNIPMEHLMTFSQILKIQEVA